MPYGIRPNRNLFCFKEEGQDDPDPTKLPGFKPEDGGDGGGDDKGDDKDDFQAKPGEDLTKKFAAEVGTGKAAEEGKTDPLKVDPPKVDPPKVDNIPTGEIYKPFAYLKGKYEGITLPDEKTVTAENQMELFEQTIVDNLDIESFLDPNVAALQNAVASGIPFEKAIEKYVPTNNMTPEQKLTAYYKERYNLKDEEVAEYIPKDPGLLKKESLDADDFFRRKNAHNEQVRQRQEHEQSVQRKQQSEQQLEKDITTTLGNFKNLTEVWGVKLTEADKTNFEKTYRNFVTPGKNGEPAPIMALLGNDDFLSRVVFIASQPNRVKDLIDVKEESLRKFYRDRLGLEPELQHSGKTNDTNSLELDMDAMRRPARD